MTKQLLGFFDSGLGGLTVLRRVLERHGPVPCVYLGDTARVPYGNRQPDEIRRSTMPSALVEMGFVTGVIDAPRLAKADHRRRLALALAAGILNYLKQEVR